MWSLDSLTLSLILLVVAIVGAFHATRPHDAPGIDVRSVHRFDRIILELAVALFVVPTALVFVFHEPWLLIFSLLGLASALLFLFGATVIRGVVSFIRLRRAAPPE